MSRLFSISRNLDLSIFVQLTAGEVQAADRTVLYDGDGHMSVNGTLEMSRFEGGYFDADGNAHYYLTDYQGNVVRVIDREGSGGQPMDYYPYGEPWVEWNWARADTYPTYIKNRFLYGGKERITQFGLGLYNFEARMYRAPLGRFSTPDKKAIDTPWLSPFAYCACNPVNLIDPTGNDIVVLNYTEGQHLAMLIQDKNGKWQYYSINGDKKYSLWSKSSGRPFNDVAVGSWDSPEEFMHSSYNTATENGKTDKDQNNFDFSEGYQIPTSPEQDSKMREKFTEKAQTDYNLFNNNCATTVQEVMDDAGIPVSEPIVKLSKYPVQTDYGLIDGYKIDKIKYRITMWPKKAFKSIMDANPQGKYIKK